MIEGDGVTPVVSCTLSAVAFPLREFVAIRAQATHIRNAASMGRVVGVVFGGVQYPVQKPRMRFAGGSPRKVPYRLPVQFGAENGLVLVI